MATSKESIQLRLKKHTTYQLQYKLDNKLFTSEDEKKIAQEILKERAAKKVSTDKVNIVTKKEPVKKGVPTKKAPEVEGFKNPVKEAQKDEKKKEQKMSPTVKRAEGAKKGDKAKIILDMMAKNKTAEEIAKVIEEKKLSTLTGTKLLQNIKGNINFHRAKQKATKK